MAESADAEVIDLLGRLRVGLDRKLDPRKKGRAYSKGNRQKVALVAAFASDVELLILDEPTLGLDQQDHGRAVDGPSGSWGRQEGMTSRTSWDVLGTSRG